VQEVTPSAEEQSHVQGLCTKVSTVMENMIVTGEGEELVHTVTCAIVAVLHADSVNCTAMFP
jgi:hypothetical protein